MLKLFYIAVALSAVAAHAMAQEDSAKLPYEMKEDTAYTGSRIRQKAASSTIPFEKSYGELTTRQQNMLKAYYDEMGPDDEPPYPINGILNIVQHLMSASASMHVGGTIKMLVDVDSKGTPTAVTGLMAPNDKMVQYMGQVLTREKYKPALCKGVPCAQQYLFQMEFTNR